MKSISKTIAISTAALTASALHAHSLQKLEQTDFDRLCTASGGLAGTFEGIETEEQAKLAYDEKAEPLSPPVGPFFQTETWFSKTSREVYALRYEAKTTHELDRESLAESLRPIAAKSGWEDITYESETSAQMFPGRWKKLVTTAGGETELFLFVDGGIETTSLYCVRKDLQEKAYRENGTALRALLQSLSKSAETSKED